MNIAVDIDGTLANTPKKWIEIFNRDYAAKYRGLQLSYTQLTEFHFYKKFGITHDDLYRIFAKCWKSPYMIEPTEFMLGQKTRKMSELCGTLDIVTANNPTKRRYLEAFLQRHKIRYQEIIFEENKERLDYDIFIDDSPINAARIFDAGKSVFLYNQPWNRNVTPKMAKGAHLTRVHGIDHAIHILQNGHGKL